MQLKRIGMHPDDNERAAIPEMFVSFLDDGRKFVLQKHQRDV